MRKGASFENNCEYCCNISNFKSHKEQSSHPRHVQIKHTNTKEINVNCKYFFCQSINLCSRTFTNVYSTSLFPNPINHRC